MAQVLEVVDPVATTVMYRYLVIDFQSLIGTAPCAFLLRYANELSAYGCVANPHVTPKASGKAQAKSLPPTAGNAVCLRIANALYLPLELPVG